MDSSKPSREQNRGLFAIGLLAVLISFKIQGQPVIFMEVDLMPFINMNIFFWIVYGFCMIISFTDDLLPIEITSFFYGIGTIFLHFSNALFILLAIFFSFLLHPERSDYSLSLILLQIYLLLGVLSIKIIQAIIQIKKNNIEINISSVFNYDNIKKGLF